MKTPKRLQPLVDDGLVDEVISQLMSGKEAAVQKADVFWFAQLDSRKPSLHWLKVIL